MPVPQPSIFVSSLRKSFGAHAVLRDVSFSAAPGSIYTLLGSNGAGKTTAIRILTTQLLPDGGTVRVAGFDVRKEPHQIRQKISLTGQFSALDEALTGRENLILMGELSHIARPKARASELLSVFSLEDAANRPVSLYSGGMKRKLDIAMSLVSDPQIIFLDEPTTGLDPQSRRSMWKLLRDIRAAGVTIFLTTQYLEEAEHLADTIAILNQGRIIAEDTPTGLMKLLPRGNLRFQFPNETDFAKARELFLTQSTITHEQISIFREKRQISVLTDGSPDTTARIFHLLYTHEIRISDFSQQEPDLEEVFLALISATSSRALSAPPNLNTQTRRQSL